MQCNKNSCNTGYIKWGFCIEMLGPHKLKLNENVVARCEGLFTGRVSLNPSTENCMDQVVCDEEAVWFLRIS